MSGGFTITAGYYEEAMAENKINAHCSICGKGYHICNSCYKYKSFQSWRSVTDTIEHYKIYLAVHRYTISGNIEAARQELEHCDLSDLEEFNPEIKSVIKKLMSGN